MSGRAYCVRCGHSMSGPGPGAGWLCYSCHSGDPELTDAEFTKVDAIIYGPGVNFRPDAAGLDLAGKDRERRRGRAKKWA